LSIAAYVTGKYIGEKKRLMKWLTFVGCFLLVGSLFFAAFFERVGPFIGIFVIGGIGIGIVLPCLDAFITSGIEKDQRGTVSSIYSSMRFIGVALGPPV